MSYALTLRQVLWKIGKNDALKTESDLSFPQLSTSHFFLFYILAQIIISNGSSQISYSFLL